MSKDTTNTTAYSSVRQPPQRCICEETASADDTRLPWDCSVLCSACCKRALRPHIERHEEALMARDVARDECTQRLARLDEKRSSTRQDARSTAPSHFSELQYESQRLRDKRTQLSQQCAAMAIQVAAQAIENEEHQASLDSQAGIKRRQLRRLEESVSEGSMKNAIDNARSQVRNLRFQWALQAFAMHRLDVRPEDACSLENVCSSEGKSGEQTRRRSLRSKEGRQKQARGIGKIGGLPLPHAGPELYGVLPPQELQSALRLVASISNTVARCLGILLPHPVLLQFSGASNQQADIIHSTVPTSTSLRKQGKLILDSSCAVVKNSEDRNDDISSPTSTSALLALLDGLSDKDNNDSQASGRKDSLQRSANATVVPPSMDPSLVSQRLRHAMSAVMADSASAAGSSGSSSTQYALAAEVLHDDEFAIALQLLQNNVIALCIRAGVPVAKLWPAEAVLLNLYALQVFCEDQVKEQLL